VNVENDQVKIVPMLFIPFVENAFKHGQWHEETFKVEVSLANRGGQLSFKTVNHFDPAKVDHKDKVGGIGLNNVRRRLNLLYPDRHSLEITRENDQFVVEMRLYP
jgi:two-component system LytT family sensor kinase